MSARVVGYRYWSKRVPVFYVAQTPDASADWGYTTREEDAIHLTPHWQRRFTADCRRVGVVARFLERAK